jgi:mannose-6-phosphate isomerase-like protein (cupin superfamily)
MGGHDRRLSIVLAFLVAGLLGCAGRRSPRLALPSAAAANVEDLIVRYPLAKNQPIRADRLGATADVSYHFVQIQPHAGERPHLHAHHDLVALILRGAGTQWIGDRAIPLGAGDSVVIPAGTPHYFVNTGNDPAVALVLFSPPHDGTDQVFLDRR